MADPLTGAIPWSVEEVRAFLRDHGRTPRELGVEQLKSWWFNLVLRVEGDGERLILRRYGITPPEEVRWELALLAHLHAHDFPTIRPLARVDGGRLSEFGGKPAILYPYVEGSNACGPEVDRRHAMTEAAALIGRLSRLTRDLALPHPRARSGANPRRTLCGLSAWAAQRGTRPDEPRFNELVARANGALDEFEARLAPHAAALPRGIVHHDGHCANVLLREGQLVALIDFDDAFEGHLVAELPVLLSNWATHGDDFVQHVEEIGGDPARLPPRAAADRQRTRAAAGVPPALQPGRHRGGGLRARRARDRTGAGDGRMGAARAIRLLPDRHNLAGDAPSRGGCLLNNGNLAAHPLAR